MEVVRRDPERVDQLAQRSVIAAGRP